MSKKLEPWAAVPFELVIHGEIHHRRKTDYDRRLALISFDNSIEFAISVYLNLHPTLRGGAEYAKKDKEKWLRNFHSKLDFFYDLIAEKKLPLRLNQSECVWYHEQRNDHYHSGTSSVPKNETIDGVRVAALWVFSVLFDISETDLLPILEESISEKRESNHSIPSGYAVPEKTTVDPNALAAAALLGQWDENNDADIEIVRRVIDGF